MAYERKGNLLEIPKRTNKMTDSCGIRDLIVKNGGVKDLNFDLFLINAEVKVINVTYLL